MELQDLQNVGIKDLALVGGKNASLGEMLRNLSNHGINVPNGFVITTICYNRFIAHNKLDDKIAEILDGLDCTNLVDLQQRGSHIRSLVRNGDFPVDTQQSIIQRYRDLSKEYGVTNIDCAVRSSSTAEDLQDASFAGQQETYLNVVGEDYIIESIKNCFASLYTDRAISYRQSIKYNENLSISVCVQKMVKSHCSGVAFSIDPDTGFNDVVVINGSWGLGELVVQGGVKPDEFIVFKKTDAIIDKKMGDKNEQIIYSNDPTKKTKKIHVDKHKQNIFCLEDNDILKLASWVTIIERYYTDLYSKYTPVDIEWAVEMTKGATELFITQARPETVHSNKKNERYITEFIINKNSSTHCLLEGVAVGDRISAGTVRIINDINSPDVVFNKGDILVTDITDPDWEPLMMKSSAVVTNKGGRTCHAAIIARELGINAVVGTGNCTDILSDNQIVTVSCAEGDIGFIYEGVVEFQENKIDLDRLPTLKTNIFFNIASPNDVFKYASYPANGVGLVREEFIINNFIKAHPLALINYETISDQDLKHNIDNLIIGYSSPTDYYVNKLAYGLARIAATFYPKDVIVRFSDFKSNEYRNLLGGQEYEPEEENPMIGWRGASRYYSDAFKDAFGLECLAIKKLREEMGLTNVIVMIPFCRTPEECIKVQQVMNEYGLYRGVNGLKLYIMCEIPSNVILADEFCKHVDGFSIGSNDLTQLTLGLDRDSALVSHIYNERNPAVKMMISSAIRACKKNGVKIGICGQGPSDYPDFAQFLVEEGVDSISITPDALLKTFIAIAELEQQLYKQI